MLFLFQRKTGLGRQGQYLHPHGLQRAERPAEAGGGRKVLWGGMPSLFGYLPLRVDFSLSLNIQTLVSQSSSVPSQKCPLPGKLTLLLSASPSIYLPMVWFKPPLTFDNDLALF